MERPSAQRVEKNRARSQREFLKRVLPPRAAYGAKVRGQPMAAAEIGWRWKRQQSNLPVEERQDK